MATGIDFAGTNVTMNPPEGEDDVTPIRAFHNGECCVTCWQLSDDERAEIAKSGKVYLSIWFGGGMPPAFVGSEDRVRDLVGHFGPTFPKVQ